jgi:hypothetical protein
LKARGVILTGLLLLGSLGTACVASLGSEDPDVPSAFERRPVDVQAQSQLDIPEDARDAIEGRFSVEAVLALTSRDRSFGGLSGLWLSPDGAGMIAISDRGQRWHASLRHDEEGRLTGADDWSVASLPLHPEDHSIIASLSDSEALTGFGDERVMVAYEGVHRLRHWAIADLETIPARFPLPSGLGDPGNSGIEALATLADGRLFGIAEKAGAPGGGGLLAWTIGDDAADALAYVPGPGFSPTGADRLEDTVYLVERSFSLLGGFQSRIVALPSTAIEPDARVEGRLLAQFQWGRLGENFEAIAARRGPEGQIFLYLLSDDNFSFLQQTLLVQLSLTNSETSNN